ncbi:MAG: hypothetical protein H6806_07885 [Planctomycetes bacterium]|nr:hypothetical protein [Planctomycetota bacterium]MCB9900152.1 hypothetical protein [Planctomycetota bacterium]
MLRRFQGGRTVRRTHRTARVVAGLLGFSLVCAWSAVAVAGDGSPTSIAHAGGSGWTTPPPPPPPMAASQWNGASRSAPAASPTITTAAPRAITTAAPRAASAPGMTAATWTPPSRYEVVDIPAVRASRSTGTPAPLVRRVAQGTPQSTGSSSLGALGGACAASQPVPYEVPSDAWTAPSSETVSAEALAALDAPAPVSQPVASRRVVARPAATTSYGTCAPACGLPCMTGVSQWHVRGVLGRVFYEGDDSGDACDYWGIDIGRTFCGCWGLDAYYRWNSGKFDRADPNSTIVQDGGDWQHVGLKITMERPFGRNSRFYWWAGLGAGYYWTTDYLTDDDGFEGYAEAGLGFLVSRNLRVRAGLNVHGMDTMVTRRDPANDGESRWLWLIAPVIEAELDF